MRHKFINSKSRRNQKSCNNLQQKYRKDVVLAAIFCFAHLKVKDTKYIILSTDSNSAHTSYVKTSGTKTIVLIADQSSMFHISIQDKYTHFKKKSAIYFRLKIYMQCAMYKSKYHSVLLSRFH